jgi:hypothetical protein
MPGTTGNTLPAVGEGENDVVAWNELGYLGAHGLDNAASLVTEDDGRRQRKVAIDYRDV